MFIAQWLKVNFVARSYSALATEDLGARLHHLNKRKDHQIVLLQRSEIFFELSKHVSAVWMIGVTFQRFRNGIMTTLKIPDLQTLKK